MGPGKTAGDFEKLKVWQKAAELFEIIHATIAQGSFERDHAFRNQLHRASISVASNIAEGFGRYSDREFMRYLSIANGSAYEVRCQIKLAQRINYIDAERTKDIVERCREISRMISGLRKTIARKMEE